MNKVLLLLLYVCVVRVAGFSSGAPMAACEHLAPKHPKPPQTTAAPYQIVVEGDEWMKSQELTVRIIGDLIGGFILQAKRKSNSRGVGMFLSNGIPSGAKLGPCKIDDQLISVTHTEGTVMKSNLTFTWKAPDTSEGTIYFQGAVARTRDEYWTDIKSMVIDSGEESLETTTGTASTLAVSGIMMSLAIAVSTMLV